jgi:hypothetical protein
MSGLKIILDDTSAWGRLRRAFAQGVSDRDVAKRFRVSLANAATLRAAESIEAARALLRRQGGGRT